MVTCVPGSRGQFANFCRKQAAAMVMDGAVDSFVAA